MVDELCFYIHAGLLRQLHGDKKVRQIIYENNSIYKQLENSRINNNGIIPYSFSENTERG